MTATCQDLQEALRTEEPALFGEIQVHALDCPRCREQLRIWKEIREAAPLLRKSGESQDLWPRIRRSLEAESAKPSRARRLAVLFRLPPRSLVPAAAGIVLLFAAVAGLLVFRGDPGGRDPLVAGAWRYQDPLLTDEAFDEVEKREEAYVASIENLAKAVRPRLEAPVSPLLVSYKEKLLLLDGAIAETRGQIEQNRYNTHLRRELLAMYAEKQRTLQDLMKEEQS